MKSALYGMAALGIASFLTAVQGCSSSAPKPSATSTPTSSAALPVGSFVNAHTPQGTETLTIMSDGKYRQDLPAIATTVEGTTTTTGDKVTFTETNGGVCTGVQGTYSVATTSAGLVFTKIQDNCAPRVADFPSGPWAKQP